MRKRRTRKEGRIERDHDMFEVFKAHSSDNQNTRERLRLLFSLQLIDSPCPLFVISTKRCAITLYISIYCKWGNPYYIGNIVYCMNATFLVFEGIDGSGKRTLCEYSQEIIQSAGFETKKYQYPDYKSPWGKIINDFLSRSRELDVSIQFLTYATDIAKDQQKIREHLKKGVFVLADRYITSTVAFQCARGFDLDKAIRFIHMFEFLSPDIIFYMNVSPQTGRLRKKGQKGDLDRHEADIEFLKKVGAMYRKLYDQQFLAKKWIEIDANKELSQVKSTIEGEISRILR